MTRKLHTKLAFNKDSHFFTNIKSISAYSLLVTMFALFTMTASITPAQAELIDLTESEPVTQVSISNAYWVKMPTFRIDYHCLRKMNPGTKLNLLLDVSVDKQGKITSIKIIKSSGNRCLDRSAIQQAKRGRMKPFMIKGKAVRARFRLPIEYTAP
ncbi:energy transducer TonB [Psychrobacter fjordensis]|uniref:energy transducer TonB n=1 Tax=Psychrobacter fjordensis TaxID=664424 RepID=UPI00191B514C|nr:energy transducer TonB [Psychrobacter fjordensis]